MFLLCYCVIQDAYITALCFVFRTLNQFLITIHIPMDHIKTARIPEVPSYKDLTNISNITSV